MIFKAADCYKISAIIVDILALTSFLYMKLLNQCLVLVYAYCMLCRLLACKQTTRVMDKPVAKQKVRTFKIPGGLFELAAWIGFFATLFRYHNKTINKLEARPIKVTVISVLIFNLKQKPNCLI